MNRFHAVCAALGLAALSALAVGCNDNIAFASQSEEEVSAFFNQKDEAALRARLNEGFSPNETVNGIALPVFCAGAGWPEGIKVLKSAGYDLNTPCALPGSPVLSPLHAICSGIALRQMNVEKGVQCLRVLIDNGVNKEAIATVDDGSGTSVSVTPLQMTLLVYGSGMADADATLAVVKALLDAGANPNRQINLPNGQRGTLLEFVNTLRYHPFLDSDEVLPIRDALLAAGAKE